MSTLCLTKNYSSQLTGGKKKAKSFVPQGSAEESSEDSLDKQSEQIISDKLDDDKKDAGLDDTKEGVSSHSSFSKSRSSSEEEAIRKLKKLGMDNMNKKKSDMGPLRRQTNLTKVEQMAKKKKAKISAKQEVV